jgi:alkylation response protein AidB-like acyl-CoA dehydrogenase
MTRTLSTQATSQTSWEPDTSLLDAAREIAPIVREHREEAQRERRLSQPVLDALRETGLLQMTTPRSLGGGWRPTLSPAASSVRRSVATTLLRRGPWRTRWTASPAEERIDSPSVDLIA